MISSSRRIVLVAAVLTALASTTGCSKSEDKNVPMPVATATANAPSTTTDSTGGSALSGSEAEAKSIFASRCSTCHGAQGKGNGPAAITLNPKPRNYTDATWQKTVTDDAIREIIVKGGQGVGKSPLMPPNADLENKPAVVNGLLAIVRSFGPK